MMKAMTITEKINRACTKKQLGQPAAKYIALLDRLNGGYLNCEESLMCEELYLLDLVVRFIKPTLMPVSYDPPKSIYIPEVRYVSITDPNHKPCDECSAMRLRIRELEEMLAAKTVTYRQMG